MPSNYRVCGGTYVPGAALRDEDGHHGDELDCGGVGLDLPQELVQALAGRLYVVKCTCRHANRTSVAVSKSRKRIDLYRPTEGEDKAQRTALPGVAPCSRPIA